MKTLIQQYKHPEVDRSILQQIKQQETHKNMYIVVIQFVIWILILGLFMQNLLFLNIQYYSIFSGIGNIGIIFEVLFQVIVGIIHFVVNNIFLLFGLFSISFVSSVYSLNQEASVESY